jgi:hypothetical protein
LATAEKTKNPALELLDHRPAKTKPQPPIAGMAKSAAPHVTARHLCLALMVLVD